MMVGLRKLPVPTQLHLIVKVMCHKVHAETTSASRLISKPTTVGTAKPAALLALVAAVALPSRGPEAAVTAAGPV
jgi:hypothetical protein